MYVGPHTNTSTTEGMAMAIAMAGEKRPPHRCRFGFVVREINPPQDKTLIESLFIEEETDSSRGSQVALSYRP